MRKPERKPNNPSFSSGPCAKRPGWSLEALGDVASGRSHRSSVGKAKLKEIIDRHRDILNIPDDYFVGITSGSNTGAFELALWAMLGARGVDVLSWENFSSIWAKDIVNEMKIADTRSFESGYGEIPDLEAVESDRDIIFAWNGTTSGVCVPGADWISSKRQGLTFCDATSAVFGYTMPWDKLDVTTWSWQKVLGSEAAHGMLVLSPRAVERLETYKPPRPLPKLFRVTKGGKLNKGIFEGLTINTPSLLACEDCIDALKWVQEIGGLRETTDRTVRNAATLDEWVSKTPWVDYLAQSPETRSRTSVCLNITDDWFTSQNEEDQRDVIKKLTSLLETEKAAYDVNSYKTAPPGLRIWCGATVETDDIRALTPWLEWGFATVKQKLRKQAA